MATLVREVERPAFLDRPAGDQLALDAALAVPRDAVSASVLAPDPAPAKRDGFSARLRAERLAAAVGVDANLTTRGGEATLDELLVGAWEGLSARRPVTCLVCSGPMRPGAGKEGGSCGDCGSHLQ